MVGRVPIAVLTYNRAHRKTHDLLLRLRCLDADVRLIIGTPWQKLNIRPCELRLSTDHDYAMHGRRLAHLFGAKYVVCDHRSERITELYDEHGIEVVIIGGARILPTTIAGARPTINLHPGCLPANRGLDNVLWAVHDNLPQMVTAHLIDGRVDMGSVLCSEVPHLWEDDTLLDINERLYYLQMEMVQPAIRAALRGAAKPVNGTSVLHHRMTEEEEAETLERLPGYLRLYGSTRL